jgi:hypothetical protein
MKEDNKTHTTNNYFYGNIGQHIDHIDVQYVTFDKDMNMHIGQVGTTASNLSPLTSSEASYTNHISTTTAITTIGSLLVNEANAAKTKAAFISKMAEIIRRTKLFEFNPGTTNQEKAFFTNSVLAAYGYQGDKCKHITDDDFQRNF